MKKTNIKFWIGGFLMLFAASSCEDQLDINENPNSATTAEVQLVLPQAIVATASLSNQFNSYGAHFGGFMANAGGFSGFGNLLNYNLTPGDWNGLWVNTYQDPLADLKYVIDNSEGVNELAYYNATAKIMTVVNYQRLVDAFGDIPYTEALKAEEGIVNPKYDDAATVYKSIFATLDEAINLINTASVTSNNYFPLSLTKATDPLFGEFGDVTEQMDAWKRYANTLKLRILIRLSSKAEFNTFVTEGFAKLDKNFIEDDAIVDPGYELNRPNPTWASWGRNAAGALSNTSRLPTDFVFGFYSNDKISDPARGGIIYVDYPTTPTNQLGNEKDAPTIVAGEVTWQTSDDDLEGGGLLKGPGMGQPLMLAAEARFLEAEAALKGFIAGSAETSFYAGITASFTYLYKDEGEATLVPATAITTLVNTYRNNNLGNRLVEFTAATSDAQRLEAIITQKYIALNMINSDEAWNEYRRTGFPVTTPGGESVEDIASNKSGITSRPDRLPTRILYPSSEQSFNAPNFRVVNPSSELIFWDPN